MVLKHNPKEVINGIPVFLEDQLSKHLQHQVDYFSKEKITETESYKLSAWQQSYVKRFTENFSNLDGKLVLDAGGGSGYMTIELAKLGVNVVCVDLTLRSLIRLKRIVEEFGLSDRVALMCCDVQKLPFNDKSFDYYISNAVLEHLPSDEKAIKEMERVCKDNAGAFIAVPLSLKYVNKLLIPLNIFHDKRIGHLRRYDEGILAKKLSNWNPKKIYYTGHFKKVIKTVVNMFLPIFDEQQIELEDTKLSNVKQGASNIIAVSERK